MINLVFAQKSSTILEIRKNYKKWQPILGKEYKNCDKFHNYVWGENYQLNKWSNTKLVNDTLTLSKTASIIKKKGLGYFVSVDTYSFSGDWNIIADFYYNEEGQLYFVFWKMNTFYAEEPLTVEKRLYFNTQRKLIRKLKSVYKINTKEKIDIGFLDKEVDYRLVLNEMGFYKNWINNE